MDRIRKCGGYVVNVDITGMRLFIADQEAAAVQRAARIKQNNNKVIVDTTNIRLQCRCDSMILFFNLPFAENYAMM